MLAFAAQELVQLLSQSARVGWEPVRVQRL
jgi:hypothetical protein